MKNNCLILTVALLLCTGPAFAQGPTSPTEMVRTSKYYQCHVDSDCVRAKDACGNTVAVNATLHDEIQKYFAELGTRIECLMAAPESKAEPFCTNSACDMVVPK